MAYTTPEGFDVIRLRTRVQQLYERVAREPFSQFHFHTGAAYAAEFLAYDRAELAELPRDATDRFAGVGNPLLIGPIHAGETVLDHACGSGTDLLLAARRVGPSGRAIGVDFTAGMRLAAERAVKAAGLSDLVDVRAGSFENLPVADASVDVVISNGVVNLAPDKRRVLEEVWRVLKPGGRLYLSDVVVARELKLDARERPELWAACVAGAVTQTEMERLTSELGFVDAAVLAMFDSFKGTSAEAAVSRDLRVRGMNFIAHKPAA